MSRVCTYLNFDGCAEEALRRYAEVFGTEVVSMTRMGDMPGDPTAELPEAERDLIAHGEVPILAGHSVMGSDILPSLGHSLRVGNNVTVCLEPDTRGEADRLYAALSEGGSESSGMSDMPWAYWGVTMDRFSVRWMINCYQTP